MTQIKHRSISTLTLFLGVFVLMLMSMTSCKAPNLNILGSYMDSSKTVALSSYPFAYEEPQIKRYDIVRVKFAGASVEVMEILNGNGGIQLETVNKGAEGAEQIGQQVDKDGNLIFPLIGKVKAEGLTKDLLRQKLLEMVAPILKDPYVFVDLPRRGISIMGEVAKPSGVLLVRERTNLLEVLTQVGSVTEYADVENVKVYRENADGSRILAHLNLKDTSFLSSPFFYPKPDDVVYVPAIKQKLVKNFGQMYAPIATIVLAVTTLIVTLLR